MKVLLDVGGEDSKISTELLGLIDILSPNETELQRLIAYYDSSKKYNITSSKYSTMKKIKGACSVLNKFNENMCVLLKRGDKGAMFIDNKGNVVFQRAMKLNKEQIVDTTGAGDTFTGSFVVEWIRQQKIMGVWNKKQEEIEKEVRFECIANAMRFGCAAAGLSVQEKGTIAAIPDLKDVVCSILNTDL